MAEYWVETISLLQPEGAANPLVKKPKLKPELLQKTQFKFLHDVVSAIQKKTGFAADLFTPEQMDRNSDMYDKDKAGKAAKDNKEFYLTAILSVVGLALDENIPCNAKEVLKGKDPEGANVLLQCLAKAADVLQMDGADAVARFRRGEHMPGGGEAARPESRRASKQTAPEVAAAPAQPEPAAAPASSATNSLRQTGSIGNTPAVPPTTTGSGPPADESDTRTPSRTVSRQSSREGHHGHSSDKRRTSGSKAASGSATSTAAPNSEAGSPLPMQRQDSKRPKAAEGGKDRSNDQRRSKEEPRAKDQAQRDDAPTAQAHHAGPAPDAAHTERRTSDIQLHAPTAAKVADGQTGKPAMPARPMSAKKAPPKPAGGHEGAVPRPQRHTRRVSTQDDASGARPGSVTGVRVFHEAPHDDEEEIHVVQEEAPATMRRAAAPGSSVSAQGGAEGHGILVRDMMAAQEAAESAAPATGADAHEGLTEGIKLSRTRKRKENAAHTDLLALRESIQTLCRGMTPLARSMDHLQEDKDSMQKELQVWRSEAILWQERLEGEMRQQADTSGEQAQLAALDVQVKKRASGIKMLKRQVIENEKTLSQLVNLLIGDTGNL